MTVGEAPQGMATGDFNHDGYLDLAVANYSSGNISILLGNGSDGFSEAAGSPIAVDSELTTLVAGAWGDGELDLAVTSFNRNLVYILKGDGSGGFSNASGSPVQVGAGPNGFVAAYLDGPTSLDLAVGNASGAGNGNTVSILLNSGAGTFSNASGSPISSGIEAAPCAITADLFDGNSSVDLAVANCSSASVSILLGDGSGGFSSASQSPIAVGTFPFSITDADFNGDGYLDLAIGLNGEAAVAFLLGDGNGTFSAPVTGNVSVGNGPHAVATADFNGDGAPDLAVANNQDDTVTILLNQCP